MFRRALALSLLALSTVLPGHARADGPQLVEAGKLIWGTSPTFMPFEYMQDGKPVGFDIDMMADLAKRMGLASDMLGMDFKGIIPAVLGHRIDAGVSGMYITPERTQVTDGIAYALIGNQLIVRKGNPKNVSDLASLCGLKVAVPTGTQFEASAKKASADCTAKGKAAIDLLSLPGSNVVALALQQGRVDAALNSTATAAAMLAQYPGVYELAGEPFDADTKLGIFVSKNDPVLKAQLEQALQAMVKDGTYAALLKKWNLPAKSSAF